tara:strand:+ start:61 stop:345 length:285 start_codon:yes stop_codon:yes gene_type:complete
MVMEKTPNNLNTDEIAQTFIHIMKEAYKAAGDDEILEEMDLDSMTTEEALTWLLELWCIDQDEENARRACYDIPPIAFMYLNERNFFVHAHFNN